MKYRTLDAFANDFKRLKVEHQATFKTVVRAKFAGAGDAWVVSQASQESHVWPKSLRVSQLVNGNGVMEMTWSFASPDGRATFRLLRERDEWICEWRRVGDHGVYRAP